MLANDPRQQLLASIRRVPPVPVPPLFELFATGRNMHWHLLDERNPQRLSLVNDVFGVETGGDGLTWDAIVACRDQETVATWLNNEMLALTEAVIADTNLRDEYEIEARIEDALQLTRIEAPRTIYHVAALYANIPVYVLFAKSNVKGQNVRYDPDHRDHEQRGMLPWELARTIDAGGIGAVAVNLYNEEPDAQD